ncbi:hypothetical protein VTN77DRAFT_7144 [Rasamsonia byssochlamydoides]|uniref:uncharacterized protein n=1 Tax=Rasamsonia byssochlamydoides TaxID=89139 RepID=UPI0037442270
MTSFLPVNSVTATKDHVMDDATTPTTPRPKPSSLDQGEAANSKQSEGSSQETSKPTTSSQSAPSTASTGDETTVAESEGDREHSENERDASSSAPPSKKKKGQRFFCTDFPPCTLSFTRSEHLARHIRKHTGERPFQCHCSRRFSRLDNLRQHAQTVHVNEEIPGDSLAATGTRFQRQIRTDRVRPQGRARASTAGSQGTHSRGHSRNLSTSSIASTASTLSQPPEIRRRPPPLIMANDGSARAHLALNPMGEPPTTPPPQIRSMPGQSPGGYPPPTTAAFTAGGGSPHYGSPISASSQPGYWDSKTHARRLSVPTGTNSFASPLGTYPPPYLTSVPPSRSPFSHNGSVYASPTSSSYASSRDETSISASEAELRRRTWHPSTYYPRPATSGLIHYETSNTLRPAFGSNGSAEQPTRLPGIESFDKVIQQRPLTPPLRKPSPMQIDPAKSFAPGFASQVPPAPRPQPPISGPGHRRGQISWDLHNNLTGLSLGGGSPQKDAPKWGQQIQGEDHGVGSRPFGTYQLSSNPSTSTAVRQEPQGGNEPGRVPEPSTPQNNNRYGWQNGPTTGGTPGSLAPRTSPEDSSSSEGVATPSTSSVEYHPAIVHSNGYVEQHHPPLPADASQHTCAPLPSQPHGYPPNSEPRPSLFGGSSGPANGMGRLEALVAVATSENRGASRFF